MPEYINVERAFSNQERDTISWEGENYYTIERATFLLRESHTSEHFTLCPACGGKMALIPHECIECGYRPNRAA